MTFRPRYMPLIGLTRWGRIKVSSVGSRDNSGSSKRLAPRRLRLLCLECLRLGWAMVIDGKS